jgi:hypothetical protein
MDEVVATYLRLGTSRMLGSAISPSEGACRTSAKTRQLRFTTATLTGRFSPAATRVRTVIAWMRPKALRSFAGDEYATAVFYPEDDRFLVERDLSATHYEVDTHVPPPVP